MSSTFAVRERRGILAALRVRDFRRIWVGQLCSNAVNWALLAIIPYHVYALTGSASDTAFAFAVGSVPALAVAPFAGVLVDRWDHRWTLILTDAGRAVAVLAMLVVDDRSQVPILYVALLV